MDRLPTAPTQITPFEQEIRKRTRAKLAEEEEKCLEKIVFSNDEDLLVNLDRQDVSSDESEKDYEEQQVETVVPKKKTKRTPAVDEGEDCSSKAKKAAWEDPDDEITANEGFTGVKKIPKKVDPEDTYKSYLERKFTSIYKTPKWATGKKSKPESDDSSEEDDLSISKRAGKLLGKSKELSRNFLNYKRCTPLNDDLKRPVFYNNVIFHPFLEVGIVSTTRTIDIFKVENKGKFSSDRKIHSLGFDSTTIEKIVITPDGKQLIVGPKYVQRSTYMVDIATGKIESFSLMRSSDKIGLRRLAISPDGKFLACRGDHGAVYLMDTKNKEFLHEFNMNDEVETLSFSSDSTQLLTGGFGGQVYIWSLKGKKLFHKFYDEGSVVCSSMASSSNGQFIATGSDSGVVNLYSSVDVASSETPRPLKAFMNLTTGVSSVTFNHSSELLSFCSMGKNNAVKVCHVSSRRVYSNFPGPQETYGRVSEICFSPHSGFLSMASNQSSVHLLRLCHFQSY